MIGGELLGKLIVLSFRDDEDVLFSKTMSALASVADFSTATASAEAPILFGSLQIDPQRRLACVPQIDTMHPNCMNGCISNLHIKFLFSLLRLAGAFFIGKRKAHLSRCGSDVLQIASISSRRICFCLSVRVLHFEKSFCYSSVNCASSPSAKN